MTWTEKGGPRVEAPSETGFGSNLIERGIPNAKVTRNFARGGFVCRIELELPAAGEDIGAG